MKRLLLFCLLLPAVTRAQTPSITFKAIAGKGKTVGVTAPVNGASYMASAKDYTLDENGALTIPNTGAKPGLYSFYYQRMYMLYVRPGNQYSITMAEGDTSFAIAAKDQEGQTALCRLRFPFYQDIGTAWYKEDTVFADNLKRTVAEIGQQLAPFAALLGQHKIEKDFYDIVVRYIRNYYATVLASTLLVPLTHTEFNSASPAYDPARIKELDKCWKEIRAIADVFDPASMTVSTYFEYHRIYDQLYLYYFLPRSKGTKRTDDFWTIGNYDLIHEYYREPLKEYLIATWIYAVCMENQFQPFVMDWYNEFNNRYPHSVYVQPALVAAVDKVKQYREKTRGTFTDKQHLLEATDTITSVAQLTARFKGKTVFMDMWATWCGPCKAEFVYNDSLRLFFRPRGVELLYISLDDAKAEDRWKDMIKYYDLQGYHIRVSNDALFNDIRKIFGTKKGGLAIPRYALIKDGKLVLENAKHPSDKEGLYKQLQAYL